MIQTNTRQKDKIYYLGIDIGKYNHQASLLDANKELIGESLCFENNQQGFECLNKMIGKEMSHKTALKIGMESTGHYHFHLRNYLLNNGFSNLRIINPIETQNISKTKIRKVKNDKVDSVLIAKIISEKNNKNYYQENQKIKELKNITRFCERLKRQKIFYSQELSVLLEKISPEFSQYFSNIFLVTPITIIKGYFIDKMNRAELIEKARKISRGRIKENKISDVLDALDNSIGKDFQYSGTIIQIKMILESLDLIKNQIQEIKKQIEEFSKSFKDIEYLSSIKGVSSQMAAVIVAEIGDIGRFDKKEQLTAFAGLDASVKESGNYKRKQGNHISKRGSKYLRKQLYYAAKTAVIFDAELKEYYQKKKKEGKHYNVIMIAVARKILMRCWALLKQKRFYELRNHKISFT